MTARDDRGADDLPEERDLSTGAAPARSWSRRRFLGAAGAGLALGALDPIRAVSRIEAAKENLGFTNLWRATGPTSPNPTGFDAIFKAFMQRYGVRAAALAIGKKGVVRYQRGYTWAPLFYRTTQPTSLFRLASVSKAFTAAAIYNLYQENLVQPSTQVFPLLAITQPALSWQTASPYIHSITVQQLVDHAGGWNDHGTVVARNGQTVPGTNWDPVFNMRYIARQLRLNRPPNKWDVASYMYGEPLQFVPGTQNFDSTYGASYSNLGYVLLGMVVETVTGQSYVSYVQQVAQALGILDVKLGRTLPLYRYGGEVTYDQPGTGLTPMYPNSAVSALLPYGGEGWLTEAMDSGGGLVTSAPSVATFIHHYAVWGLWLRPSLGPGGWYARSGSFAGLSSYAVSRGDGVDYAFILNTRNFPGATTNPPDDLFNSLQTYIDHHPVT